MFAMQHYIEAMHDPGRKRSREDDDGFAGFSEHRHKRLQSLPLRSSPKPSQQWPLNSATTPLHNDALPRSHFSPWSSSPLASSYHQDADMDMSDSAVSPSPYRVRDGRTLAYTGDADALGRIPTPIQPSFAAQVRGQHCEWAGPGPEIKTLDDVMNMGHHQTNLSDDHCVPRVMAHGAEWHAVHTNRRLPSPISEVGDTPQSSATGTAGMMVDDENSHQCTLAQGPPPVHSSPTHAMHHPNAMMDIECQPPFSSAEPEPEPANPSPGRRGHVRSKHTVNSWTWQPGMKKSFSIGYRSDCEKCRLKVPGHFNHIVIS